MCCVKGVEKVVCIGASICRRKKKTLVSTLDNKNSETRTGIDSNITTHTLFTSMREELGVYLLESVLVHNATWTLLEREGDRRVVMEMEKVRLRDYTTLMGDSLCIQHL